MSLDEEEILEIEKALQTEDSSIDSAVEPLLEKRFNVILYGPPGTGKTRAALEVRQRWARRNGADSVLSVTFHPSYGYEDFVRGYKPVASEGTLRFEITDGILLNAFAKAREKPTLLVIDEINRGDVTHIRRARHICRAR